MGFRAGCFSTVRAHPYSVFWVPQPGVWACAGGGCCNWRHGHSGRSGRPSLADSAFDNRSILSGWRHRCARLRVPGHWAASRDGCSWWGCVCCWCAAPVHSAPISVRGSTPWCSGKPSHRRVPTRNFCLPPSHFPSGFVGCTAFRPWQERFGDKIRPHIFLNGGACISNVANESWKACRNRLQRNSSFAWGFGIALSIQSVQLEVS